MLNNSHAKPVARAQPIAGPTLSKEACPYANNGLQRRLKFTEIVTRPPLTVLPQSYVAGLADIPR